MQSVLASGRRLAFYLVAWVPVTALIGYVVWASGMPAGAAAQVLAPSCLLYAFICLSPYYVCRALPLGRINPARLALTFIVAASLASATLVGTARLVAYLLERP